MEPTAPFSENRRILLSLGLSQALNSACVPISLIVAGRLEHARAELEQVRAPEYVTSLVGRIGADPIHRPARGGWREDREATAEAGGKRRVGTPSPGVRT